MPTWTGQRRRLSTRAWARRTGTVAMVAAFAVAALAGPAQASKISDKRAQIASIERQLNEFDMKLEASIQAYDDARQHLSDVRVQIHENTIRLGVARHNLKVARVHLAAFLVSSYKQQSNNDPTAYVLGSGSFSGLVDRVEYVQRIGESESALLGAVTASEKEIASRQSALRKEEKDAAKLLVQAQSHRAEVENGLRARQHLLDGVRGDLRLLIDQRQQARDRAAREAAAKLARQQAQPPADSGGSNGGSSGGSGGGTYTPPPAGTLGEQAAALAQQYLGVPYVWGGASPSGFDCSGLVVYVYGRLGVSLPHYTGALWTSGSRVSSSQLAPGDLVFFYPDLGHVGIYIGGGLFIHAPHTGDVVKISSLSDPWYSSVYMGAVRISG
jgi:cell wall-associated NlpC family hydrolase